MRLTPVNRLTPEQAREIRQSYAAGSVSQGILARRYGVSQATINSIVLNKTYIEEKNDEPK